jgi:hypothetical protein
MTGTDHATGAPAVHETEPLFEDVCGNDLFDVLGNQRRRYIICYVAVETDPVTWRELAEQIAAWEGDTTREQVPESNYQSVYNSLYQSHLPQLAAAGLVEYDQSENLVYATDRLSEVQSVLGSAGDTARTWTLRARLGAFFLAGAVAGATLVVLNDDPYVLFAVLAALSGVALIGGFVR